MGTILSCHKISQNWVIIKMIFTGNRLLTLLLFAAFHSVMALPLTEESGLINSSNNLDTMEYTSTELLSDKSINKPQNQSKTQSVNTAIFSEQDINARDIDLLESSDYFDTNEPYQRRSQYGSINNTQKAGSSASASGSSNINNTSGNILSLLNEEAVIEPELKAKIKDSLESIKQVKDAFITDSEISYEDASRETEELLQKERYLRETQSSDEARGINNKVTREKYTPSMFREFIEKVFSFVLYAVILGVFIKLLMMFIAWQRKLNQY